MYLKCKDDLRFEALLVAVVLSLWGSFGVTPSVAVAQCVAAPSGIVSWWPADETTDDIASGFDGALENGAGFAPGLVNQAFRFDGDVGRMDDRVDLSYLALDRLTDLTVELWVQATDENLGQSSLLSGGNSVASLANEFVLYQAPPDDGNFTVLIKGTNYSFPVQIIDGEWHHVAFTRSGTTGTLYIDGELVDSLVVDGAALSLEPNGLMLGQEQDCVGGCLDPDQALDGLLDEVTVYERALSEGEVASIFAAGSAGKCRQAFFGTLPLLNLDGTDGFAINGATSGDQAAAAVSFAGDVNGDGLSDVVIGSYLSDPNGNETGQSHIVFGATGGFAPELQLADLDGDNGFALRGIDAGDRSGWSVSGAGDVNGDGFDDLLIGAIEADPNGLSSGEVYVAFGRSSFPPSLELSDLDGTNGFVVNGVELSDSAGWAVSDAGDVNGDGLADLMIGAPLADPFGSFSGQVYILFGQPSYEASFELRDLNGSNGFTVNGMGSFDFSGISVSRAGDVNGDGLDDVVIGAYEADPNGTSSGESYVVYGSPFFPAVVEVSDLDGSNGFAMNGITTGDQSGFSVSGGGDVNLDGFDDVVVGAAGSDVHGVASGQSYLVLGGTLERAEIELAELDGSGGVKVNGLAAGDESGFSVASAGDVNGDGLADVILGAPGATPNGRPLGESYLAFGRASFFAPELELSDLNGNNGFAMPGAAVGDQSGWSVAGGGDFNGDGLDDVLIGSPEGNGGTGQAHIVFGRSETGLSFGATGACPGTLNVRVRGVAPLGLVALYSAGERGSSVLDSPCAGTELGLDSPHLLAALKADNLGQLVISPQVGASACGLYLQAVDVSSCGVTNVTQISE